jgi:hypothetical protein
MIECFIDAFILVSLLKKPQNEKFSTKLVHIPNVLYQYKVGKEIFIPPNIGYFCFPEKISNYNNFHPKFFF